MPLFIFLFLFFLNAGALAADIGQIFLNDGQIRDLTQAVCDSPVEKTTGTAPYEDTPYWRCMMPRDYPGRNSNDACALSFDRADAGRIWRGHFTDAAPQLLASYHAECEPHANSWGGAALFNADENGYRLIRYYAGAAFIRCVVLPGAHKDQLFCNDSYTGQGDTSERFGPIVLMPDGTSRLQEWLRANQSADYDLLLREPCAKSDLNARKLCGLLSIEDIAPDGTDAIAVTARWREITGASAATKRFQKGDFNTWEKEQREIYATYKDYPILREGEYIDQPVKIVFGLDKKILRVDFPH